MVHDDVRNTRELYDISEWTVPDRNGAMGVVSAITFGRPALRVEVVIYPA
jgi:hypothetical protein